MAANALEQVIYEIVDEYADHYDEETLACVVIGSLKKVLNDL